MSIRDRPITPRSPWQNGHVERLIGARHLRHLLANYATYYNGVRTHREMVAMQAHVATFWHQDLLEGQESRI